MSDIWLQCKGRDCFRELECSPWRLNKIDNESSMRALVDSSSEAALLMELMHSKSNSQDFVFLEPPLEYASRFGERTKSSIWYGSLLPETAMAEKAFYMFNFMRASHIKKNKLLFEAFKREIKTNRGIDLSKNPFLQHRTLISSPSNYAESQKLGTSMRIDGVEAFYYYSARTTGDAINIGAFIPNIFRGHSKSTEIWQCEVASTSLEFVRVSNFEKKKINFSINQFLVDNRLPFPAR